MAILLSDNLLARTTLPADAKYGPYIGTDINDAKSIALAGLELSYRYEGLTVGLKPGSGDIQEWWFVGEWSIIVTGKQIGRAHV